MGSWFGESTLPTFQCLDYVLFTLNVGKPNVCIFPEKFKVICRREMKTQSLFGLTLKFKLFCRWERLASRSELFWCWSNQCHNNPRLQTFLIFPEKNKVICRRESGRNHPLSSCHKSSLVGCLVLPPEVKKENHLKHIYQHIYQQQDSLRRHL